MQYQFLEIMEKPKRSPLLYISGIAEKGKNLTQLFVGPSVRWSGNQPLDYHLGQGPEMTCTPVNTIISNN